MVLFSLSVLLALHFSESVFAAANLGLETSSFFRKASDRDTTSSTLIVGPHLKSEGRFQAELDFRAYLYLNNPESLTYEAPEAYFSYRDVTLGRRVYHWSRLDDTWSSGLWTPRFLWDPLRPEPVGLTGAFYEKGVARWKLRAFATGISPPEREPPVRVVDGKLVSDRPMWASLPDKIVFPAQIADIRYSIDRPSTSAAVLRPGGALALQYRADSGPWSGFWGSARYGYLPIHQIDYAVDGLLQPAGTFDAVVKPYFWNHHLATLEAGMDRESFAVWGSVTGEWPETDQLPSHWIYQPLGNAIISGGGGRVALSRRMDVYASYIRVDEESFPRQGIQEIDIELPSRFPYTQAARSKIAWHWSHRLQSEIGWIFDIDRDAHLNTLDFYYQWSPHLRFNAGADMILSSLSEGWFGQYNGDDRVRMGVHYAF